MACSILYVVRICIHVHVHVHYDRSVQVHLEIKLVESEISCVAVAVHRHRLTCTSYTGILTMEAQTPLKLPSMYTSTSTLALRTCSKVGELQH